MTKRKVYAHGSAHTNGAVVSPPGQVRENPRLNVLGSIKHIQGIRKIRQRLYCKQISQSNTSGVVTSYKHKKEKNMSQEKVNRYKEQKKNRKNEKKKARIAKAIRIVIAILLIAGLGSWTVWSVHTTRKTAEKNNTLSGADVSDLQVTDEDGNPYTVTVNEDGEAQILTDSSTENAAEENTEEDAQEETNTVSSISAANEN